MLPFRAETLKDFQQSSPTSFVPESFQATKPCSGAMVIDFAIGLSSLSSFSIALYPFIAGNSEKVKKHNEALPIGLYDLVVRIATCTPG